MLEEGLLASPQLGSPVGFEDSRQTMWATPARALLFEMKEIASQEAIVRPTRSGYIYILGRSANAWHLPLSRERVPG